MKLDLSNPTILETAVDEIMNRFETVYILVICRQHEEAFLAEVKLIRFENANYKICFAILA